LLYGDKPQIYRAIYRVLEKQKQVEVLHIRHGARRRFKGAAILPFLRRLLPLSRASNAKANPQGLCCLETLIALNCDRRRIAKCDIRRPTIANARRSLGENYACFGGILLEIQVKQAP
jgi:hypothetical protein